MKIPTFLLLTLALAFISCSPNSTEPPSSNQNPTTMQNPYPFRISEDNDQFTIMADIESEDLYKKYYPLFTKYEYEGNGPCWEGHITQILEKKDPQLLDHLDFDPEAGAFFVYADTKETQLRFIQVLSPIFSDLVQLEDYIKSADRSRIDD
jgi:hypothetical protein